MVYFRVSLTGPVMGQRRAVREGVLGEPAGGEPCGCEIWGKRFLGGEHSKCENRKGQLARLEGVSLEASVANAEWGGGSGQWEMRPGDESREVAEGRVGGNLAGP